MYKREQKLKIWGQARHLSEPGKGVQFPTDKREQKLKIWGQARYLSEPGKGVQFPTDKIRTSILK